MKNLKITIMKKSKTILAGTILTGAVALQGDPGIGQGTSVSKDSKPEEIRPFQVKFPQADLDDLRRRVLATRWPTKETVADETQGVQLSTMQALARYWATDYDWRKVEAKLNSYPQFVTNIDGVDIHFIHVRSKHPNALPVIITHGWPGSIIEQLKIIALSPILPPMEVRLKTPSMSLFPRFPAMVFQANRRPLVGNLFESHVHGSN
jgi:Epoxide hydrolase N terminus